MTDTTKNVPEIDINLLAEITRNRYAAPKQVAPAEPRTLTEGEVLERLDKLVKDAIDAGILSSHEAATILYQVAVWHRASLKAEG